MVQLVLDIANAIDEGGADENRELLERIGGIGYRALTGYLRAGIKEIIELQANYYTEIGKREYAEFSDRIAHDFLNDLFGEENPDEYILSEEEKEQIRNCFKKITDNMDGEEDGK